MESKRDIEEQARMNGFEEIKETWAEQDIILLGDPGHGENSIDMLIEYYNKRQDLKIHTLFIENIDYNDGINYAEEVNINTLPVNRRETFNNLREFCTCIIGLETRDSLEIPYEKRCNACLKVWPEVIKEHFEPGNLNIACVGTAHLVKVIEKDEKEEDITVEPLSHGISTDLNIPIDKISSYAVVDYEDVAADADSWQEAKDQEYKPKDGEDTVQFIQYPFVDELIDDDSDGGRHQKRKQSTKRKKRKKSRKRKKRKKSRKRKKRKKVESAKSETSKKRRKRRKNKKGEIINSITRKRGSRKTSE